MCLVLHCSVLVVSLPESQPRRGPQMYCIQQDGLCCFVSVPATCNLGFCRPIYAGNALETVQCSADSLQMFSVRTTAFEKATTSKSASAAVEPVSSEDLTAAQVVTSLLSSTRQQTQPKAGCPAVKILAGCSNVCSAQFTHGMLRRCVCTHCMGLHHPCMYRGTADQRSAHECTFRSLTMCCAVHLH